MVTEALVVFAAEVLSAVLGIVPEWAPPTEDFAASSYSLGAAASRANGYFPVALLGVCLLLVIAYKFFLVFWRLLVFIYHQFWGSD